MKTIEWGYLIVLYLFLGGLSAGLFFVSAIATLMRRNGDGAPARIGRWGALLAPWPVLLGCGLLVFDLGKKFRFYKLFLHLRWTSPMSIGAWLLLLFAGVALAYAYLWMTDIERQRAGALLPIRVRSLLEQNVDGWRRKLALTGLPLSVGVGIYTGVLLGAVQSRPFWNTNLVAQLFLFSALSTGCAGLLLVLALSGDNLENGELHLLYALDIAFLTLEFFVVVPYVVHGELSVQAVQNSLQMILGGRFTGAFWVSFLGLGLVVPLAIEVSEMLPVVVSRAALHTRRWLVVTTATLILAGGFLLRYIFVYAGQMSAFQ